MNIAARASIVWAAWKFVIILALLLVLSLVVNAWQLKKLLSADAECRADMYKAASIAIENERERASKADIRAGKIVQDTKAKTAQGVDGSQRGTNEREQQIRTVVVAGACRMPAGVPSLRQAVDEANAAAR